MGEDSPAAAPLDREHVTDDAFLGGRLRLLQPKEGYRAATDPVLLAAACSARSGETVLDVGSGVGAAAFCLAARMSGLQLIGVEAQPAYAALSERNAARNGVASWRVIETDVAAPSPEARALTVDHVVTNPPFFAADAAPVLPNAAKDRAHRERIDLGIWIDFCLRRLRPKGALTMIHRTERLGEILSALSGRVGGVVICPLWPRRGVEAKRVVIRGVKEARSPLTLSPGLVLHGETGDGFTADAEAILRGGTALDVATGRVHPQTDP